MSKIKVLTLIFLFGIFIFAQASLQDNPSVPSVLAGAENVTLDFKDADIQNVLRIISYKAGVNIVTTSDVIGNVTIRLVDVPWDRALDTVLKTYGFGYERQGNIITVAPIDKLTNQKKQEVELAQVQPTVTEVFNLKYIDAQDVKKALEPQLSPRGKITILEMTGQGGWQFASTKSGEGGLGKAQKETTEPAQIRSKVLIVSDIPPALDKIREVIAQIDVIPKQVLIETKLIEVNKDRLKDFGLSWGTGSNGATTSAITATPVNKTNGEINSQVGGNSLDSLVSPSAFNPISSITGVYPYNAGLSVLFQKLTGAQFSVLLHALEEDVHTNTLSAPKIMVLNNQEATILVGTKYPLLTMSSTTNNGSTIVTASLNYYQDIGIQLNVIPQIGADNSINMVIHPAVSDIASTITAGSTGNEVTYPIISIREAETRILMKDGETVIIGGLLKDIKTKSVEGIPFLKDLPWIGQAFRRDTVDVSKIELLIFITARVVKDGEFTPEEISRLQKNLNTIDPKTTQAKKKK